MKRTHDSLLVGISVPRLLLIVSFVFVCSVSGVLSSGVVTLDSLEIFTTHEFLPSKPTVYFTCQGENKTVLPDVKKTNFLYTFKGEESWQPLTDLTDKKCKRCGLYEQDSFIKSDDVFDEWELCPSDFVDEKYVRFKDKEFNATFICHGCDATAGTSEATTSDSHAGAKRTNVALVVIVSLLASILTAIVGVGVYRYWQRRKRVQDQARFLKLFEETDDIDDELGLGPII